MTAFAQMVVAIAVGLAALLGLAAWRRREAAAHRRRMARLNRAAALLERHADALGTVLAGEAVPEALKSVLVRFSESLGSEALVLELAQWLARRDALAEGEENEDASGVREDIRALARRDPDMADAYEVATFSGLAGAMLRWPATAALFSDAFSEAATAGRLDPRVALAAIRLKASAGLGRAAWAG